jgi:hypothetical protein
LAITIAKRLPAVLLTTLSLRTHATLTQSSLQHLCNTATGKGKGKAKAKPVSKAAVTAAAAAAAARAQAQADALQLDKEYKTALEPVRLEILPLLETSGRSSTLLMTGAKAAGPAGMSGSPFVYGYHTSVLLLLLCYCAMAACYHSCVVRSCWLAVTAPARTVVGAVCHDDIRQQLHNSICGHALRLCWHCSCIYSA